MVQKRRKIQYYNTKSRSRLHGFLIAIVLIFILTSTFISHGKLYSSTNKSQGSNMIYLTEENSLAENSIQIVWGQPSAVVSKYILIRDNLPFTTFHNGINTYQDTGLIPNTYYKYQIEAITETGAKIYSNAENIETNNSYETPLTITNHQIYSSYSAFGDSITFGQDASVSWYDLVSRYLKKKEETKSFNDGVSGDTTVNLLARITQELAIQKPDIVTLMIGTNDVRGGSLDSPAITNLEYKNNVQKILSQIDPSNTRSVFLISIPYFNISKASSVGESAATIPRLLEFNKILIGLANQFGIPYIDVESRMQQIKGVLNINGLHPNNKGDSFIASQVINEIALFNK